MKNTGRIADHPINPLILHRWSPRAMNGTPIDDDLLKALFEAARWAPSSYNGQPWRFIYAKRDTKHFDVFMGLLIDFNKSWCKNAAVLTVVISRTTFEQNNKPSVTHSFDTGAAWENLAIEGTSRGLVVHGMQGFDFEKARQELKIPEGYEVNAMFAVGNPAPKETLSPELKEKEVPSSRKKIEEFIMEGTFRP